MSAYGSLCRTMIFSRLHKPEGTNGTTSREGTIEPMNLIDFEDKARLDIPSVSSFFSAVPLIHLTKCVNSITGDTGPIFNRYEKRRR